MTVRFFPLRTLLCCIESGCKFDSQHTFQETFILSHFHLQNYHHFCVCFVFMFSQMHLKLLRQLSTLCVLIKTLFNRSSNLFSVLFVFPGEENYGFYQQQQIGHF